MAVKRKVTTRKPKKGLTAADKAATIVHLADTVKENVAHADTHVQMAKKASKNPISLKHNLEHADHHVKVVQDHARKLGLKLALDPKYKPAIRQLKQAKKIGTA